jgi:hypothetical protein
VVRYQDDQTRDVTRETTIESNVPDVASVETDKPIIRGERVGEATLLVRYQGTFGAIPVTVLNPKPGFVWKPLPQHNDIDRLVDAKLERLKIQPSPVTDDATVFRRLWLDLTGRLPSPESVRAFLDDPAPSRLRRAKAIDRLIASPEYVDHWTVKWGDLLQSSRKYLGEKGAYEFQQWIHDAIAANRPYDKLVRELLTARGSSYDNPAANYFRVTREPKPAMERRPHRCSWASAWCARSATIIRSSAGRRISITRCRRSSRRWASAPGTKWARRSSSISAPTTR